MPFESSELKIPQCEQSWYEHLRKIKQIRCRVSTYKKSECAVYEYSNLESMLIQRIDELADFLVRFREVHLFFEYFS